MYGLLHKAVNAISVAGMIGKNQTLAIPGYNGWNIYCGVLALQEALVKGTRDVVITEPKREKSLRLSFLSTSNTLAGLRIDNGQAVEDYALPLNGVSIHRYRPRDYTDVYGFKAVWQGGRLVELEFNTERYLGRYTVEQPEVGLLTRLGDPIVLTLLEDFPFPDRLDLTQDVCACGHIIRRTPDHLGYTAEAISGWVLYSIPHAFDGANSLF